MLGLESMENWDFYSLVSILHIFVSLSVHLPLVLSISTVSSISSSHSAEVISSYFSTSKLISQ